MLNEYGQVMGYKLTHSTAFDAVSDLLSKIKDRLSQHSIQELLLVDDNCFHWRAKLLSIFNTTDHNCRVILDLFHAAAARLHRNVKDQNPLQGVVY